MSEKPPSSNPERIPSDEIEEEMEGLVVLAGQIQMKKESVEELQKRLDVAQDAGDEIAAEKTRMILAKEKESLKGDQEVYNEWSKKVRPFLN